MLAEDVLPNRFERARRALEDLSYTIQQRGGHRLALVVFAGRAQIVCPLTHDYDHFRAMLENLDLVHLPAGLRPENKDAVSGTRIGAGLETAILALDEAAAGYQDMLLLSDGDDPAQDGEWRTGAEAARRLRIPVHTVGVGNPDEASPIPGRSGEPFLHNREVVRTRLEEEPLRAIAGLTGGTYTPARTNTLPLGELFRDRIEPGQVRENTQDTLPLYQQRYSWFLTAAFALLTFELMAGGGYWRITGSKHHSADRT
jgi:Ca-activated chloride channel family protein